MGGYETIMEIKKVPWQLIGFAVTSLGGTLLHFLYEWTGENVFAAFISGVNESTWEHMKLIFFPMFFFALVQSFFFKDDKSFWSRKLHGILTGLLLIPLLFYGYNGIIGPSPDWLNISIFYISAAAAFITEARAENNNKSYHFSSSVSFYLLLVIASAFIVFTFFTPRIALFRDPLTGTFGIDVF